MAGINSGYASTPPPRQPEERQEYRKSLHKSSNSPHWKGAYREVRLNRSAALISTSASLPLSAAVQEEAEGEPREVPDEIQKHHIRENRGRPCNQWFVYGITSRQWQRWLGESPLSLLPGLLGPGGGDGGMGTRENGVREPALHPTVQEGKAGAHK